MSRSFKDFINLKESFLRKGSVSELVAAHAALQKHESIPLPNRGDDHSSVRRKLQTAYDAAKAYHSYATR